MKLTKDQIKAIIKEEKSTKEAGQNAFKMIEKDSPLLVTHIDSEYYQNPEVQDRFFKRGL